MEATSNQTSQRRVGIVDYGMGNLRSVQNALSQANLQLPNQQQFDIIICTNAEDIQNCERLLVPGQGAMSDCMDELIRSAMIPALLQAIDEKKPTFGVCVGLQMLLSRSQETPDNATLPFVSGLDLISGDVKRFEKNTDLITSERLKIPHMGWSRVHFTNPSHPLWSGIKQDDYFYFVHSFYAVPTNNRVIAATSHYGVNFCCALIKDNLFATQFHPEKSGAAGLRIYFNFLNWSY